ncbi:MAG: O-antigen ligase family protein [Neisseriaceae bacterium]|nr:O-antigen ligase family protein [Neisseriaceae bacterium]
MFNTFNFNEKIFAILFFILGLLLFFSSSASNLIFYLIAISSIVLIISTPQKRSIIIKEVLTNRLVQIILLWLILLYASVLYSSGDFILQCADKYKKYFLIPIIIYGIIYYREKNIHLNKLFLHGVINGGLLLFIMSISLKFSGLSQILLEKQYISYQKIINGGYIIPNDFFITSILYCIIFSYAIQLIFEKKFTKGIPLLSISIFMVTFVLIQRTGYIALLIMTICMLYNIIQSKKIKFITILLVIASLLSMQFFAKNILTERFAAIHNEYTQCSQALKNDANPNSKILQKSCSLSIGLRTLYIHDSIQQIKQSPIYGHGLGSSHILTIDTTNYDKGIFTTRYSLNPHNEYLLQGIQLGIIGIILLIIIFTLTLKTALNLKDSNRNILIGIVLVYIVSCLFNSFLLDAMEGIVFIMILSTIVAINLVEKKGKPT